MNKKNIYRNAEVDRFRTKWWWRNNRLHREDGPACEYADGHKEWYRNSELHREDGPAIEFADGKLGWWLNGITYSKKDYYKELVNRGLMTYEDAVLEML